MKKKIKKIEKPRKKIKCIDCGKKTDNYYSVSINSGKITRCNDCHELWIIRSTRYDPRFSEQEQSLSY
jgi:NAD-dependent SIR2 family protein deacetylase